MTTVFLFSFFKVIHEDPRELADSANSTSPILLSLLHCKSEAISLTIGERLGIIDELIQAPYYPEFANHNTYGIKAVNDTVYNYMKFAANMDNGCLQQIQLCWETNRTSLSDQAICAEAENMCRDNVEGPYYYYGGRGVYDIRHPFNDPTPPSCTSHVILFFDEVFC